ncbi:protein-lysine methyltransferase METTL21C-like [Petromyzon marinus]|uniref:protein-lysine methyltransferase METTL21C-like n=1 Tax=Petromyzon marinus TaxID=7757 RepID=UPI003F6EAC5F
MAGSDLLTAVTRDVVPIGSAHNRRAPMVRPGLMAANVQLLICVVAACHGWGLPRNLISDGLVPLGEVVVCVCLCVRAPQGVRLARFLEANQQRYPMAGRSVLELGAGTGLVSIVCSLLGADVTATDLKEVLGSLSTNIANNTRSGDGRPRVRELTWGLGLSAFDGTAYDYVVASDLVYREASLGPLALTLRHFLEGARGGGGGGAGGGAGGARASGAGGGAGGARARGATAFFALKLRFGFCEEFLRRLRRTFRVRALAEWPEERMLLWELSGRRRAGGEAGEGAEAEEEEEEDEEEGEAEKEG